MNFNDVDANDHNVTFSKGSEIYFTRISTLKV